mmetsp:Transcript_107161/g.268586  ORF Transcript_107161/g.268586 Transcript_107161/m.268586 type:complete len:516 (+) Transcript_107161:1012-2559(+)
MVLLRRRWLLLLLMLLELPATATALIVAAPAALIVLLLLVLLLLSVLLAARGCSLQVQRCSLITSVQAELAVATVILCEPDEIIQRGVIGQLRFQDEGLGNDVNRVFDQLKKLNIGVDPKVCHIKLLPEIFVVIESQMAFMEGGALRIVDVVPVGVGQQVQLEAQAQHCPVLPSEIRIQGLSVADVVDVFNLEGVNLFCNDLLLLLLILLLVVLLLLNIGALFSLLLALIITILLLLILGISLLALCLDVGLLLLLVVQLLFLLIILLFLFLDLPLLRNSLRPDRVTAFTLLAAPVLKQLAPLVVLLVEAAAGLQVLHPLRQLPFRDPSLQIVSGFFGVLPSVAHLIEALGCLRNREACKGSTKVGLGKVLHGLLREPIGLLLLCQLHGILCFLHNFLDVFLGLLLLDVLLFAVFILIVLLLLFLLLGNPPLFFPLSGLNLLLPSRLTANLFLFLIQQLLVGLGFEVCRWLTHDYNSNLLERLTVEIGKGLLSLLGNQVISNLHDNIVSLEHGRN